MKKLYYVKTNAYDMIVSDDGETRRIISNEDVLRLTDKYVEDYYHPTEEELKNLLGAVEDDSSWEVYEETVKELTEDADILAEIDWDDE